MRIIMSFALAIVGFVLASAPSAEAASTWRCMGPSYACSAPAKKVARKWTYKKKYTKRKAASRKYKSKYKAKSAYKAKKKSYSKRKYAKRTSKKRYSGGGRTSGIASYYWQPQRVASGGWFNPNALTAAHKTLPFGTRVRVTNQRNGKSVVVRINDRGPYIKGRVIDLSKRAAGVIGMRGAGIAPVRLQILGRG
ncbi:MAG: septal ring lytic transglycosylase RlpA family protein [Alphaproteobacteria bacterium]|nr:septal ring lytic transglycosylase RlpA family protein [Alphaproteobacteria bacterium]